MFSNAGYLLQNDEIDANIENLEVPLQVNACGYYRLINRPNMSILRPNGRCDYQLLYVASGKAWFTFDTIPQEAPVGSVVIYPPGYKQQYIYYQKDHSEVYWIHFTGYEAERLLHTYDLPLHHVIQIGISTQIQELFQTIIRELQVTRPHQEQLLQLKLQELFLLTNRLMSRKISDAGQQQEIIEEAVRYFNENYYRSIEIQAYARQQHISTCWFIRSFRQYMGMPPLKYLTTIRTNRAKELLEGTAYTISEIGAIVGYDNPLYFSRIFRSETGMSPKQYRKMRSLSEQT